MNHLNSYERVTAWHSLTFVGITTATILMSGTGMLDSIERQLVLLAVLLPFAGIPHGALDYKVAQDTLEHRMGKLWSVFFLTGYVILMAAVLLAWQINPSGSLAVFLCITALHFGTGDTLTTVGTPTSIRIADAVGRGGTVLTFPALFFPEDVALLFSYLIAENDAWLFTGFLRLMAPLTVLAMLSSIGWYMIQYLRYRDNINLSRMLELIALMAAFSLLPALLAFTIYFSFLHSARHLLYLAACINADDLTASLSFTLTRSIPVTAATIGLAVMAYLVLAETSFNVVRLTQVIFIGIACVTYPHVAVIAVAQRRRILKYQAALLSD